MIRRLTDNYKKTPKSNIGKLFSIVKLEVEEVKKALKTIELWRLIDNATGETLDKIGLNVDQRRNGLDDVMYRIILKLKIRANRSGGQIEVLNDVLSILLDDNFISVKEVWNDPLYYYEPAAVEVRYSNFIDKIRNEYQDLEDDPWFLDGEYKLNGMRLLDGGLTFSYADYKDKIIMALRETKNMARFIKTGGVRVWWCEPLEVNNNISIALTTEALLKSLVVNNITIQHSNHSVLKSTVINRPQFILDGVSNLDGMLNLDGIKPIIVHTAN